MADFKIGDTVRITSPRPIHGTPPRGEGFGEITSLGESMWHRYAYVEIVGFGQWGVDFRDLALVEPQNMSAPSRGREW